MQEDMEDGMVVLQALVEGMVLEVHVTNRQALESGSTPQVEIYTQFGSQVKRPSSVLSSASVSRLYVGVAEAARTVG